MANGNNVSESKLTKKDLVRSYWTWQFFSHANYNYERLQATAFAASMGTIIRKLYTGKEDIAAALKRHLVFFNTEPNFGAVIHGIVIAMEEKKANGVDISDEAINSVKTGLMGPLAGLGDTLTQGTIIPLLLAIGISFGVDGSLFGPLFFLIGCPAALMFIAYTAFMRGYISGKDAVESMLSDGRLNQIIAAAGILGVCVIGALIGQFVNLEIVSAAQIGSTTINIQADIFDKIMPKLLPLLLTVGLYKLLQKGKSPIMLMLAIIVVSIVGTFLGIL